MIRRPGAAVTDRRARGNLLDIDDMRPQGHDRLQRHDILPDLVGRPQTIEGYSGPDHGHIGVGIFDDAGAVGAVANRNIIAQTLFDRFCQPDKFLQLFLRKGSVRFIRPGKMGEHAFHLQSFCFQRFFNKIQPCLIREDPDPAHASIHSNMYFNLLSGSFCRRGQLFQHVFPKYGRTDIHLRQFLIAVGEYIAQQKDRLAKPCFPQFHSLFKSRYGITPDIVQRFQDFGNFNGSVPISVGLENRRNLNPFLQISFHAFHVGKNGIQTDVSPDSLISLPHTSLLRDLSYVDAADIF